MTAHPAAAWREALEKATKGPWTVRRNDQESGAIHYDVDDPVSREVACVRSGMPHDARLIVSLRSVAEAMVKWMEAREKLVAAHNADSGLKSDLRALIDFDRACNKLYAALVAAAPTKKK